MKKNAEDIKLRKIMEEEKNEITYDIVKYLENIMYWPFSADVIQVQSLP